MKKNITFTLPAEAMNSATGAFLLGDFNNWNPQNAPELEAQPDGSFKTIAQLEEGKTYQYRFLLNDGRWVNDYHAQNYVPVFGFSVDNCVITVPESKTEENKKSAAKPAPSNTKVVKASEENQSLAKPKATKKATSNTKVVKTEASKAKKAKSADAKMPAEKAAPKRVKETGKEKKK